MAMRSSSVPVTSALAATINSFTSSRLNIWGAVMRKPRAAVTSRAVSSRETMSCQNLYLSAALRGAIAVKASSMLWRV